MKAIAQDAYGSADVLELRDIDMPVLGDHDVLVRVHAAAVNPGDWHFMRGQAYIVRLVGFGMGLGCGGRGTEFGEWTWPGASRRSART